jgi:DNA polymerase III subunit gamma/tau
MSDAASPPTDSQTKTPEKAGEYVVVARRYRPKNFTELVGQNQVAQALRNAIMTNRVGHAYLFTGARGVGKTSTARIFAKCLNCVDGPTSTPCGQCDSCLSIASGEDVDVLEIDGASNRGIDNIRELRSNVNVRPSRARFKIYIIDEVHMLSREAFNALLKTLEEPPEHVKFVFCTTEANKIPITVLSRCQRFDFAPVATDEIVDRLRFIVTEEGREAEDGALQLLARRAGGSMRDSQSLLEQLLSFCGNRVSEGDVHAMLGTANTGRLANIGQYLIDRQAAGALAEVDAAVREGVDIGQLAEQLLGYFRDMMTAVVGCPADLLLHASSADHAQLAETGNQFGLETLLAAVQILDQALARMRQTTQVRTLVEMALVRICHLESLDDLSALIASVQQGVPLSRSGGTPATRPPITVAAPPPEKKKQPLDDSNRDRPEQQNRSVAKEPDVRSTSDWTQDSAEQWYRSAAEEVGGVTTDMAVNYESLAIPAPNVLVVELKATYNKEWCERSDVKRKLEQTMAELAGRPIRIDFTVADNAVAQPVARRPTGRNQVQKMREIEGHPLVQEAVELFEAEVMRVEPTKER